MVKAPIPAEQSGNYSYSSATWNVDSADPRSDKVSWMEIRERMPLRLKQKAAGVGTGFGHIEGASPLELSVGAFAILCLVWAAIRRRRPGDICSLVMLAVLSIAHASDLRLVLPIYLFAIPATLEVLAFLIGQLTDHSWARLAPTLLLVLLGPSNSIAINRGAITKRHEELSALAAFIDEKVEPDARVAAWDGARLSVYLERPVFGLEFVARSETLGGLEGAFTLLEKHEIDYVMIEDRRGNRSKRWVAQRTRPVDKQESLMMLFRSRLKLVGESPPFVLFRVPNNK